MNWQVMLTFKNSQIAWEDELYGFSPPPELYTLFSNAHMKLTSKCMCIFINHPHSHSLEPFTQCFGDELRFFPVALCIHVPMHNSHYVEISSGEK